MAEQVGALVDVTSIGLLEGDRYITFNKFSNLGTGASRSMVIQNPQGSGLIAAIDAPITGATGRVDTVLRRNVTIDAAGTSQTPRNARVGNSDAATMTVQNQPTISGGTIVNDSFAGSGGGGSNAVAGDQSGIGLLVNPGNNVHIRATNNTNSTIDRVHLEIDFTEFSEDLIAPES